MEEKKLETRVVSMSSAYEPWMTRRRRKRGGGGGRSDESLEQNGSLGES